MRASSLVKDDGCLWDLSKYQGGTDVESCAQSMKYRRPPPTSPERVAREIHDGLRSGQLAFTAGADSKIVIEKYQQGFEQAINNFRKTAASAVLTISYEDVGWGQTEFEQVKEAMLYAARHCRPVSRTAFDFAGNFDVVNALDALGFEVPEHAINKWTGRNAKAERTEASKNIRDVMLMVQDATAPRMSVKQFHIQKGPMGKELQAILKNGHHNLIMS